MPINLAVKKEAKNMNKLHVESGANLNSSDVTHCTQIELIIRLGFRFGSGLVKLIVVPWSSLQHLLSELIGCKLKAILWFRRCPSKLQELKFLKWITSIKFMVAKVEDWFYLLFHQLRCWQRDGMVRCTGKRIESEGEFLWPL